MIALIGDFLKIKSLWVAGGACQLSSRENLLDIFLSSGAKADIHQRAYDEARHIVQEVIRMYQNLHLLRIPIYLDLKYLSFRGLALLRGGEVLEIMLSDQKHGSLLHHPLIGYLKTVVGVLPVKYAWNVIDGHAINVSLGGGI